LRHLVRLIALSPFELIVYRPILIWAPLRGVWGFLRGERVEGEMERNTRVPASS